MKKVLFLFIFVFTIISANAQTIVQKRAFKYDTFIPLNSDYKPLEVLSSYGIIVFSEAADTEYITVTIGEEVYYSGPIKTKKKEQEGNEITHVYLFTTEFQGTNVPLQLFEIYDSSISTIVPQRFIVAIHSALNGEYIQGQSYEGISRIK